jgi:hypothetical protein
MRKSKWMYQGLLKRKDALLLARHWTALGKHSVRLEHSGRRKLYHVYLKFQRRTS